ncbi:MAG: N-acetyl-gamma-glutamyl-phosphate reductase [Candidatus Omnitrophica bacterium]|nr:N-acetyl-gamma-glutamyl-phosphate reductase [Candidatus Omnitrophota bacterium]
MVNVSVVGATGYTGEELVAILSGHKLVKIGSLSAIVDRPMDISDIIPRLKKKINLICAKLSIEEIIDTSDLVFLALPHTVSMLYVPQLLKAGKKVIDLSADYRLPADSFKRWYGVEHSDKGNIGKAVYGLPELNRNEVKNCALVANPGCYPTGVILGLAPLIRDGLIEYEGIIVDAKSGITGAGRKASIGLLFGEVADNFKAYKIGVHQHTPEILLQLEKIAANKIDVLFVPHVVPTRRGILSTIYVEPKSGVTQKKLDAAYFEAYGQEPFVRYRGSKDMPELKDVIYTNYCDLAATMSNGKIVIVTAIDNLTKGAAGQAVQNMNIMCGFDEAEGLF